MAFLAQTRQSIRTMASNVNYSSGGRQVYQLPPNGLLTKAYLHVHGVMTVTLGGGTVALSEYGPYNLINRLKLIANQGHSIIDLSGYGAHVLDLLSNGKGWEPDDGQGSAPFAGDRYQAGVADGANTWDFTIPLNVTPNDRDPIGAILLQTDQMKAELQFEFNSEIGASNDYPIVVQSGSPTASFVGTVEITLETFTIPAGTQDKPDVSTIYQQLERQDGIETTGPNRITLLRSDIYQRVAHLIQIGGAPEYTNLDRFRIQYNGTDTPYDLTLDAMLDLQRRRYGRDLPAGVYVHDFGYQGVPGYGGQRDLVKAGSVSEFASIVDVASGASPSPTNSWIRTLTQQFVSVQVPGAARR